ncbi:hypothetical protein CQA70_29250, partial [Klebsiella pneumoniae]
LSREAQRQLRRKIQFVYQNPFASLDPRQTLFAIIEEPLKNFERLSAATRRHAPVCLGRVSAARHSVSCGARSSLSTRTPSLRSTRARRCLR